MPSMRLLPTLVTGEFRVSLPVSDRSAAVLARAILDDSSSTVDLLAETLAVDPSLALWATARSYQRDRQEPRTIAELAGWLKPAAAAVLWWEATADPSASAHIAPPDTVAELVKTALETADAAALLASDHGQAAAERAYLAGLLHDAERWLHEAGFPPSATLRDLLPPWLCALDSEPCGQFVQEAKALISSGVATAEYEPDASRRRAERGLRRWQGRGGPLARMLPLIAERMRRLNDLEHRFEEILETEKLAAMAEFAAGAGHEINNPLAIVAGRAQLLLTDETDPERRRELAVINAQVKRAYEMIADMRLFARPPMPQLARIDVSALIAGLVTDLAPGLLEQAITLEYSGGGEPIEIEADAAQLQVALRAICRNSAEAISHQGRIEIAAAVRDGGVEIGISDNGPGIAPEHRRHAFDPFYSSRQAGRGLGLGLSKAWRIVTMHGGRITIDTGPGRGTKFTIRLPATKL